MGGLKGLLEDIIGHGASKKYLYIIGGFASFIFMSNIFGLFFFLQPPTGNPNTTFGLGLTAFLYYNWQGIKTQGLGHYIKHFMGPILVLAPLMFIIELIGHLAHQFGQALGGGVEETHVAFCVARHKALAPVLLLQAGDGHARRQFQRADMGQDVGAGGVADHAHADHFAEGNGGLWVLENPISEDMKAMRPSLLPGLLAAAKRNIDRGAASVRLFEIGRRYLRGEAGRSDERAAVGVLLAGEKQPRGWASGKARGWVDAGYSPPGA